jgi:flagellar biosynthesis GTPase FlhF
MVYIVVFLAGMAAATSALGIWYYTYITGLRRERELLKTGEARLEAALADESQRAKSVEVARLQLDKDIAGFDARKVQYDGLVRENKGLKQDCFNLSIQLKKMERDQAVLDQRQGEINGKANGLAARYLKESVSWIGDKLNSNNFSSCKQRLLNVVEACRSVGFDVPDNQEQELVQNLQSDFEQAVRDEFARQEQARIKSQIREEEKLAREIDKQIKDAEREKAAIQTALEKALKETRDEHSVEVERLKSRLKEAEEKSQRAISQAQLTKSGNVYVLSNIGSFGEDVYKIGMTRRLDPMDRVKELGDASVPFPFDVHMMISCDDAPGLENAMHREFHKQRLNKVNFRKEFFRIDLGAIQRVVESRHGVVEYVATPEALQYRESINMPDEDYEFIEHTVESVVGDAGDSFADEE